MNTKPKKAATSDTVYTQLKEDILHLVLAPGEAISEIETAAKYNVSRTPVRDAFKSLEKEGLLEIRPHIGTFISLIDVNQISDLLYMREVMEQSVLCDLSHSITQAQALNLRIALKEQETLLADSSFSAEERGIHFLKADNDFHRSMFITAGRENVWKVLTAQNQHYERFRALLNLSSLESLNALYEAHVRILDAVNQRDEAIIKKEITNHIYDGFTKGTDSILKYERYFLPAKLSV